MDPAHFPPLRDAGGGSGTILIQGGDNLKRLFKRFFIAAAAAAALSLAAAPQVQAAEIGYGITVREENGWKYAYDASGSPFTGWFQIGDSWFFSGIGGGIVTGERGIDGKAYTFASDGHMISEGVHRDGFEDDIYNMAVVKTDEYWSYYQLALELLNMERASNGLAPLRLDRNLCVIATYRANHMWKYGYAGHRDAAGNKYHSLAAQQYFGTFVYTAENINHREADPDPVITDPRTLPEQVRKSQIALVNSPPHRKLMNDPKDTAAGFGIYSSPSRELFVQIFAEL